MRAEERDDLRRRAPSHRALHLIDFDNRLEILMETAAGVVAMGGYNTFCEILSLDKRALIVPRVRPARGAADPRPPRRRARPRRHAAARGGGRSRPHGGGAARLCPVGPCRRETAYGRPLDGLDRIGDLVGAIMSRRGKAASDGSINGAHEAARERTVRLRAQGLSAAVRNLHRRGDPRARAARFRHPHRGAAAPDRRPRSTPSTARSRRPVAYLPEYLHHAPLRVLARLVAPARHAAAIGAAWRRFCADLRRDLTPQPRPPVRPGPGAGRRDCRPASRSCTPISSTRRPASWPMRPDPVGPALDLLGPRQGHLDLARLGPRRQAREPRAGPSPARARAATGCRR